MSKQLAELLLKDKIINQAQFQQASENSKGSGKGYIRFLIEKKVLADTKLVYYLSQKFGLPSINLSKFEVQPDTIKLFTSEMIRKTQCIPIQTSQGTVVVATCDPANIEAIDTIKFKLKMNVEMVLTTHTAFDAAVHKYYGGVAMVGTAIETFKESFKKDKKELSSEGIELVTVHEIEAGGSNEIDAPVITLVNGILSEAIRRGASDIHVENFEKRSRVRMRIDGILHEVTDIPTEMKRALIARLKIMSRMDIAESRVPQDGRIKLKFSGSEIDFRVNSMPTLFGEKVVLRILNKGSLQLDLVKLGFEPGQLELFKKGIKAPNGMILVTGPTGSGKTTTLYSALMELNQTSDNLSTAEDPVEYNLEGINQTQIHKEIGLTFANVLRSLLRQDPDTILVGEIRDYETAEVAIQAALTGHLVLSTLHTNDSVSSITRLMNMGIEPFLVVASLNLVVAQRLLRTVCKDCTIDGAMTKEKLITLGIPPGEAATAKIIKGKGCQKCAGSGYRGRVAIYEVLDFSQTLKEMVLKGENIIEIKKRAIIEGMKTLRAAALTKAVEGRTSMEEALSMTLEH